MRFVLALAGAATVFGISTAANAAVRIDVNLASQSMHVSSSQGEFDWPISSGRAGHRTPTGNYRPQFLAASWFSRKYDNAPMPHAIFFHGGYAIHGTYATGALGHVASHGCIRLAPENAAQLFDMVRREGASIAISGQPPGVEMAAVPHAHRAVAHARHGSGTALAFAPHHRARSLREWADNPLGNQ